MAQEIEGLEVLSPPKHIGDDEHRTQPDNAEGDDARHVDACPQKLVDHHTWPGGGWGGDRRIEPAVMPRLARNRRENRRSPRAAAAPPAAAPARTAPRRS